MKKIRRILILIPLLLTAFSVLEVVVLKWIPVCVTPLMIERKIQFKDDIDFHTRQEWTPLKEISGNMVKAVISSEDNLFAEHNGFDRKAIKAAIKEKKEGKRQRGGSTISQQTAKNVFTLGRKTWLRKAVETWYTFLIEKIWGKERIMEVYLNVAEMGKGIYGAGAASRTYFNKSAGELTISEASLIAVCLPNPMKMNPDSPSPYIRKRQRQIVSLSGKIEYPEWVR